jgi:hypothetical protein
MNIRKIFLYSLIASVAICAILGIGVLVFGEFGDFAQRVLLTTFTITCTSILGLACGAYYESKGARALPFAGIAFAIIAAVLFITEIWTRWLPDTAFVKVTGTASMLAVTGSLISLLSLASLDRRFAWSRYVVIGAAVILDAILLWILWFEPTGDSDIVTRTIGVLSIVIAAMTVVTPVFHKLSNSALTEEQIRDQIEELEAKIYKLNEERLRLQRSNCAD